MSVGIRHFHTVPKGSEVLRFKIFLALPILKRWRSTNLHLHLDDVPEAIIIELGLRSNRWIPKSGVAPVWFPDLLFLVLFGKGQGNHQKDKDFFSPPNP